MPVDRIDNFQEYLRNFTRPAPHDPEQPSHLSGTPTEVISRTVGSQCLNWYVNEFWTARQRQAASIHEISYRACFKPQLPRFFILRLSQPGDRIYDPFSGRGTTPLEAALCGRDFTANDINPLSRILTSPRLAPPSLEKVAARLGEIRLEDNARADRDLSMFYHPRTEAEIVCLRNYLKQKRADGLEDTLDDWIRLVATNRLTGHSRGFFSVYTLPPNQATSPERQKKINEKRDQVPEYRDIKAIIQKKTASLIRNLTTIQINRLKRAAARGVFLTEDAGNTSQIPDGTIQLTVTSPPFLDVVQYAADNWLRCWFNDLDTDVISGRISQVKKIEAWSGIMGRVFCELFRITRPGGWVAFEVGEVRRGRIKLEDYIIPLGLEAGFGCAGVLINLQAFTKTSNIWGVNNNERGTNSNRIVMFRKDAAS